MNDDDLFEPNDEEQNDGFFDTDDEQPQTQSDGFFDAGEPSTKPLTYPPDDPTYYEKLSYGKSVYRRVQRWRRRAARRGMEIPYLAYELHKPDKPRIFFWILAIISAIIFAGIVVGIGALYVVVIKNVTGMPDFGSALSTLFDKETLLKSGTLSGLAGFFLIIVMILLYTLLIAVMIIPFAAAFYFYISVRDTFYMAKCSKEEFAEGNVIGSRIFKLGAILVALTIMFIVGMVYVEIPVGKTILGILYAALMLALGGLLALILLERHKCKKWFETLDTRQQQNYLAHDQGIRKIKRRKKKERDAWNTMFP